MSTVSEIALLMNCTCLAVTLNILSAWLQHF